MREYVNLLCNYVYPNIYLSNYGYNKPPILFRSLRSRQRADDRYRYQGCDHVGQLREESSQQPRVSLSYQPTRAKCGSSLVVRRWVIIIR